MIPASFRTGLALTAAAALSACGSEPVLSESRQQPLCGETFSEGIVPLADSLLVIEQTPTLSAEQEQRLAQVRANPAAGRVVVARLADQPEPMLGLGRRFVVSVSITRSFVLLGQELYNGPSSVSWYGWVLGERGEATLTLTSEGITGILLSIPRDGSGVTRYSFHPLGAGLHAVVCIDPGKLGGD